MKHASRRPADRRWTAILAGLVGLALGFAGCSDQMSGPEPELKGEQGDPDQTTTQPGFTCVDNRVEAPGASSGDLHEQWVTVRGSNFAPVVQRSLEDPDVQPPTVELRRTADIYGEYDGEHDSRVFGEGEDSKRLRWKNDTTLRIRLDNEVDLRGGIYDVIVTNPSGETARKKRAFGILPRPTVATVQPDLACVSQGSRTVTVRGGPFLKEEGAQATPDVQFGGTKYEADDAVEAVDCEALGGPFGDYRACSGLRLTVDQEDFSNPGARRVSVTNVEPAPCSNRAKKDGVHFRVTGPPQVDSIGRVPLCSKQRTYEQLEISGSNFIRVEDASGTSRPTVRIEGKELEAERLKDCAPIGDLTNEDASRCSTALVRIQAGDLDRLAEKTNTPLQQTTDAGTTDASTDGGDASSGDTADGSVGDTASGDSASGDTSSGDTGGGDTASGDTAGGDTSGGDTSGGDAGDAGAGDAGDAGDTGQVGPPGPTPDNPLSTLDVEVVNPQPAGCESSSIQLPVVPPPVVHDSTPDPICNGPKRTVTVDGAGFVVLGDGDAARVPSVMIDGSSYSAVSFSKCADSDASGELTAWSDVEYTSRRLRICKQVEVEVPSGEISKGGTREVTAKNPKPASCQSEGSAPLQSTPIPSVSRVEPKIDPTPDQAADPICTAGADRTIVVYGSNFYAIGGDKPTVGFMLNNMVQDSFEADRVFGCQKVGVDNRTQNARRCSVLQVTIPSDRLSTLMTTQTDVVAEFGVQVTNPAGAACTSSQQGTVHIAAPPQLSSITESFACLEDGSRQFTVSGGRFLKDNRSGRPTRPLVEVDGQFYRADQGSMSGCSSVGSVSMVESCSELTFTIPQKGASVTANTPHDVRVHQPGTAACPGTQSAELEVDPVPTVTDVKTPLQTATVQGTQYVTDEDPVCTQRQDTLHVIGQDFYAVEDPNAPAAASVELTAGGAQVEHRIPRVRVAGTTYAGSEVSVVDPSTNCTQIRSQANASRSVYECTTLAVATPAGKKGLGAGSHRVRVQNPINDPAAPTASGPKFGCTSDNDERVRYSEPPKLTAIEPEPICTAQYQQTVRAVGGDYLIVNPSQTAQQPGKVRKPVVTFTCQTSSCSSTPQVTFTGSDIQGFGCIGQPMEKDDPRVQNCNELQINVPQNSLAEGTYAVRIQNPMNAECTSPTVDFTVVEPPQLDDLRPQMACVADQDKSITAVGDFLVEEVSGSYTYPTAIVDQKQYGTTTAQPPGSGTNCTAMNISNDPSTTYWRCDEVVFQVPQGDLTQGNYGVSIRNPQPAQCRSNTVTEYVKPEPVVTSVAPSPICTEDNQYTISVTGQNFYEVDGTLPDVDLKNKQSNETITATGVSKCIPASNVSSPSDRSVRRCQEIEATVPQGALTPGATTITDHQVVVTNPAPLDCNSDQNVLERDAPPPQITPSASTNDVFSPGAQCPGSSRLVFTGDYFFEMGGRTPVVTVTHDGQTEKYFDAKLRGNCRSLTNTSTTTRECDKMLVELDKHTNNPDGGQFTVRVKNPRSVQCATTRQIEATESSPPEPDITDVRPKQTCSNNGQLDIYGERFKSGITASLGPYSAQSITFKQQSTNSDSIRDIIGATWGPVRAGSYNLQVTNPNGCFDVWGDDPGEAEISVVDGPLAVYLDPPIHYNKIELQGLLYFTNGNANDVTKVQIRGPNGVVRDLNFSLVTDNGSVVTDQLNVTLPDDDPQNPGNPLPPGNYDVRIVQNYTNVSCGQWQSDLLQVVGNTALNLTNITPSFGWQQDTTSVEINEDGGTPAFQSTPRAYLNPGPNTTGTQAVALRAVAFQSSTELTGIVPSGLPLGDYQVVVINPNGDVGVLPASSGFTVTREDPPVIDTVNPGSWESPASNYQVDVIGQNFRGTPTISVWCDETGTLDPSNINVTNVTGTKVDLTVDTGSLNDGEVCELTLTNPDGTKASYSPIPIFNPAFNFINFTDAPAFNFDRRGLVMASGEPTRQQRFLYGIGGDDTTGPIGNVYKSGEFAQIDDLGNPQSFRMLPYQLDDTENGSPDGDGGQFGKDIQFGRVFADGARLRDFVYLVGGNDGTAPVDDVLRANVLDPLHTPAIEDIDFRFGERGTGGLSPGVYYYRVSAVHDETSDHNPSGETLPSDVQPVYVPDVGKDIRVQIEWNSDVVSNSSVKEYRLYRSPSPGEAAGDEKLLTTTASVAGQNNYSYLDDGSKSTTSQSPLPVGSLGVWHDVASLSVPRQKHEVRVVTDPSDSTKAYLYVLGGENTSLTATDTIERITISDDPNVKRDATVTGVTQLGATLSSDRTELDGYIAAPSNADVTGKYLYAVGGKELTGGTLGGATGTVDIWPIQSGGSLGTLKSSNNVGSNIAGEIKKRAGFVGTIANDFGINFGGQNGDADGNGSNTSCGGQPNCNGGLKDASREGDIVGWDSLGGISMTPRYQHGGTAFVGFLYLGGGQDGTNTVVDSVEYSPIGTTRRD